MKEQIGTAEAAELIGVTRARISQLCKSGDLKADFVSNVWLIDKDSVREYSQQRRRKKNEIKNRR